MRPDPTAPLDAKASRLFVAFAVSDAALDEVIRAIEPWRGRFPGARWVPRENMHVTLKFLGRTLRASRRGSVSRSERWPPAMVPSPPS